LNQSKQPAGTERTPRVRARAALRPACEPGEHGSRAAAQQAAQAQRASPAARRARPGPRAPPLARWAPGGLRGAAQALRGRVSRRAPCDLGGADAPGSTRGVGQVPAAALLPLRLAAGACAREAGRLPALTLVCGRQKKKRTWFSNTIYLLNHSKTKF